MGFARRCARCRAARTHLDRLRQSPAAEQRPTPLDVEQHSPADRRFDLRRRHSVWSRSPATRPRADRPLKRASLLAVKFLVVVAGHVELLNKLQRGSKQTIRVEHVHVCPGGQAIVGNAAIGGREVGQSEHQPHATDDRQAGATGCLTFQPIPALPCQNPMGQDVPSTSGRRQVPVPHARRRNG